jgi:hypothetical protein
MIINYPIVVYQVDFPNIYYYITNLRTFFSLSVPWSRYTR